MASNINIVFTVLQRLIPMHKAGLYKTHQVAPFLSVSDKLRTALRVVVLCSNTWHTNSAILGESRDFDPSTTPTNLPYFTSEVVASPVRQRVPYPSVTRGNLWGCKMKPIWKYQILQFVVCPLEAGSRSESIKAEISRNNHVYSLVEKCFWSV